MCILPGQCEFEEIKSWLSDIAHKLPFKAEAVSQAILDARKDNQDRKLKENTNKWTMQYIIQNNLGGCNRWMAPIDFKFFGKYK